MFSKIMPAPMSPEEIERKRRWTIAFMLFISTILAIAFFAAGLSEGAKVYTLQHSGIRTTG